MKKDELKNAPKLLCERAQIGYTAEFFALGLQSGTQGTVYSFTPQHAKRLSQYLAHQVSEFEKQHSPIDAEWSADIISPVQPGKDTTSA